MVSFCACDLDIRDVGQTSHLLLRASAGFSVGFSLYNMVPESGGAYVGMLTPWPAQEPWGAVGRSGGC